MGNLLEATKCDRIHRCIPPRSSEKCFLEGLLSRREEVPTTLVRVAKNRRKATKKKAGVLENWRGD
jgi:hypothetical protein